MSASPVVLAVIPARAGSKGVPRKPLVPLGGRPLISYTIRASLSSRWVGRTVVSTDSREIARIAVRWGAEAPFIRPGSLAMDETPTLPVIQHAVAWLELRQGYRPDIVVTLQPTSPFRPGSEVDRAVEKLVETGADSVAGVAGVRQHPLWMKLLDGDRLRDYVSGGSRSLRRQALPPVYILNGAIWATRRGVLMEKDSMYGDDCRGIVMDEVESFDIDTPLDLGTCEAILRREGLAEWASTSAGVR